MDELNVSLARSRLSALVDYFQQMLTIISPLVIPLYGGHMVMASELSLGTMLASPCTA